MTISEQLDQIQQSVQSYCNPGGKASVVNDLVHLWQQLTQKSTGLRVLIMYAGEVPRGPFTVSAVLNRVDRRFLTVVTRGRSLTVDRGSTLYQGTSVGQALYVDVENVRDTLRALQFDPQTTERPVDYAGITPFSTEGTGMIVDAYQIEFTVGTDIPAVESTPEGQVFPSL